MCVHPCTTPEIMPPALAAADPPMTRAEFTQLMARVEKIERRSIRTETRVMRLMEFHGLDGHGQPLPAEV